MRVLMSGPTPPWAPNPYVLDLANALGTLPGLDVTVAPVSAPFPRRFGPTRTTGEGALGDYRLTENPRYRIGREIRWHSPLTWVRFGLRRWDIVHLQWWNYALLPEFWLIARLAMRNGATVVVTAHNAFPHEDGRVRRWCNRAGVSLGAGVIVHTEATRSGLVDQGLDDSRITIIPHGVQSRRAASPQERLAARRALGLPDEARVALHFGALRPYKQTLELLDRFSASRDGRLIVAGAPWGDYGEAVRAKVAALQLEEYVTLDLRTVDEDTKARYYAAADVAADVAVDVAAVPRSMDAASGAVAEALSYGLEIEGWDSFRADYLPWREVAVRTAAVYRELLGTGRASAAA